MAYAKAAAAVVVAVLMALVSSLTDDTVTNVEWVQVAIAAATAAAVFTAPNVPGSLYTKSALAAIMAALQLLVSYITNGITTSEWLNIAIAVLGALGVYAIPNRGTVATRHV